MLTTLGADHTGNTISLWPFELSKHVHEKRAPFSRLSPVPVY
jgi:hypothetical protein